jgi:hypothetical protein
MRNIKSTLVAAIEDPKLNSIYNKKPNGEKVKSPSKINIGNDPRLVEIYEKLTASEPLRYKTNKLTRNERD